MVHCSAEPIRELALSPLYPPKMPNGGKPGNMMKHEGNLIYNILDSIPYVYLLMGCALFCLLHI